MVDITIYRFLRYDIDTDKQIKSDSYATLETISRIGASPLQESSLVVNASEIDGNGFYCVSPAGEA
jgi:hypothetical protein